MRSLSNIIKSGRIRSQGYLDLSQHLSTEMSDRRGEWDGASDDAPSYVSDEIIENRQKELSRIELEIQGRVKKADDKIEQMLKDAMARSREIVEEAEAQRSTMLAEMDSLKEEILKEAQYQADTIRKSAHYEKQQILEHVEEEVVETIIDILKHVVSEEIQTNVDWIRLVVRKMMLEEHTCEAFRLFVSPHNFEQIEANKDKFIADLKKLIDIVADEMLSDSSCILETDQGNIEYDISNGLEKVITELRILKGIS